MNNTAVPGNKCGGEAFVVKGKLKIINTGDLCAIFDLHHDCRSGSAMLNDQGVIILKV